MTEKISSQYHKAPSKMYRRGFTGHNLTMARKIGRACLVWSGPKIGPTRPVGSRRWTKKCFFLFFHFHRRDPTDRSATDRLPIHDLSSKNSFFLLEIQKFWKNQRRRLKRSLSWTAQNEYQINQVSKEIQKTSGKKRSSIIWVWTYAKLNPRKNDSRLKCVAISVTLL